MSTENPATAILVGDDVLVRATVTGVLPDAWGPGRGVLYDIRITTADGATNDAYASFVEPSLAQPTSAGQVPDTKSPAEEAAFAKGRQSVIDAILPHFPNSVMQHQGVFYLRTTPRDLHEMREALGLNKS